MDVPIEISYHDVRKTDNLDNLVREKAARLDKFHDHITSCSVAVELEQNPHETANMYRVRINLRVPPGHELVVNEKSEQDDQRVGLEAVIRRAFGKMEKQLKTLKEKQHEKVKEHPAQAVQGIVKELHPDEDYGFIQNVEDGRDIYFHRNSVHNDEYDRLEVGTGVRFDHELGDKGFQATFVQIVAKPGE